MVTHGTPLDELHAHACGAVTLTVVLPPELEKDRLVGEMEEVQEAVIVLLTSLEKPLSKREASYAVTAK
jgi:hypothetical protein